MKKEEKPWNKNLKFYDRILDSILPERILFRKNEWSKVQLNHLITKLEKEVELLKLENKKLKEELEFFRNVPECDR